MPEKTCPCAFQGIQEAAPGTVRAARHPRGAQTVAALAGLGKADRALRHPTPTAASATKKGAAAPFSDSCCGYFAATGGSLKLAPDLFAM